MNSLAETLGHKTVATSLLEDLDQSPCYVHDPKGVWHLYIHIEGKGLYVLGKATSYVTTLGKAFNQHGNFQLDIENKGKSNSAHLMKMTSGTTLPCYKDEPQRVRGDMRHIWIECKEVLEHMAMVNSYDWESFNKRWEPVVTLEFEKEDVYNEKLENTSTRRQRRKGTEHDQRG